MLNSMRSLSQSAIIKGLFLFLIFSFVMWGIGDVFQGGGSGDVATVGTTKLSYTQFNEAVGNEANRVRAMFGGDIPKEIEVAMQSHVLNRFINDMLIKEEVARLGLGVHDEQIRDAIQSDPNFQKDGVFDPDTLARVLQSSRLSKREFSHMIEEELTARQMTDALTAAGVSLKPQAVTLYQFEREKRDALLYYLPPSLLPLPDAPEDSALLQYYDENKENFATDGYRRFTVMPLTRQMVAEEVSITNEAVTQYYNEHKDSFLDPATGTPQPMDKVEQSIREELTQQAIDETMYQYSVKLEDTLAGGTPLKEAAAALGFESSTVGPVNEQGLLQNGQAAPRLKDKEELLAIVFQMPEGGEPVVREMNGGYLAIQLDEVVAPQIKPLEDVRGQLIAQWKEEQRRVKLEEMAEAVRAAMEQGAPDEEVRKRFGLSMPELLRLERQKPPLDVPAALAEDIFNRRVGEPTVPYGTNDGGFIIGRVTGVTTPKAPSDIEILPMLSQLQTEFYGDVLGYYQNYLSSIHKVDVRFRPQETVVE